MSEEPQNFLTGFMRTGVRASVTPEYTYKKQQSSEDVTLGNDRIEPIDANSPQAREAQCSCAIGSSTSACEIGG